MRRVLYSPANTYRIHRNESVDATPSGTPTPVAPTPASPSNNRETRYCRLSHYPY